jgi:hypothetical protein
MIESTLEFEHNYEADLLDYLPGTGSDVLYFPKGLGAAQDGLIVSVRQPASAREWIGIFAFGSPDFPNMRSGIYSSPNKDELCVLSRGRAFLVRADQPEIFHVFNTGPVLEVKALLEFQILLLVEYTRFAAINRNGVAWRSDRLVKDDLRFEFVRDSALIVASGWDPVNSKRVVFHVSPESGQRVQTEFGEDFR